MHIKEKIVNIIVLPGPFLLPPVGYKRTIAGKEIILLTKDRNRNRHLN